jgi:hypothetical protein
MEGKGESGERGERERVRERTERKERQGKGKAGDEAEHAKDRKVGRQLRGQTRVQHAQGPCFHSPALQTKKKEQTANPKGQNDQI